MDMYKQGLFGQRRLEKKRGLHISPDPDSAEKYIFDSIPGVTTVTIDVRPAMNTDIVANISAMPEVPTGAFDFIFACGVFIYVERMYEAVAELFRVLKPGGALLTISPVVANRKTILVSEPSAYLYSQEDYDKYRVGFFRSFGELDYVEHFNPYFDGKVYFGQDASSNKQRISCFFGLMNAALVTPLHRLKSCMRSLVPYKPGGQDKNQRSTKAIRLLTL